MVKLIKIYELSPDKATAANMTSNDITKYTREKVVYWQNIFYQGSKAGAVACDKTWLCLIRIIAMEQSSML